MPGVAAPEMLFTLMVTLATVATAVPGRSAAVVVPGFCTVLNSSVQGSASASEAGCHWLVPETVTPSVALALTVAAPVPACVEGTTSLPALTSVGPV